MNVTQPKILKFTNIDTVAYTTVAGVAGYIDTDCSASCGLVAGRVHLFLGYTNAAQVHSARKHGATTEPKWTTAGSSMFLTEADATGHVDLWRNAAEDNYYKHLGYFE